MTTCIFALFSLCLVFSALGIPIDVQLYPPTSDEHHIKSVLEGVNPQLLGGGVEGDMILPKGFDPTGRTRGTAKFGNIKWPSGIIPYDISAITDVEDQKKITDAMQTLMYAVATPMANTTQRTACVYFRPRVSTDTVYFTIQYGTGCSASQHNFNKYAWGSTAYNQGSTYDYASIMHYETTAFTMNGKPTMIPRQTGVNIGYAEQLSPTDITEVRHLYGCTA